MSTANGTYAVQLGSSSNNWANGALVVHATGATYKGNTATVTNPTATTIQWVVNLTHNGAPPLPCSGNVTFTGALNSSNQPTSGTASGPCIQTPQTDGMDSWSAEVVPESGY